MSKSALVVDDDLISKSVGKRMLEYFGFEVTAVGDGIEAMDQLAQHGPPDLILVDWQMPRMNGQAFLNAINAEPEYAEVRTIMCSGVYRRHGSDAIDAGADAFLRKPFTIEQLRDILRSWKLV